MKNLLTKKPPCWEVRSLQEVATFITKGATPTTYGFEWVEKSENSIPFLRSECVSSTGFKSKGMNFISIEAHDAMERSKINAGDLLMTITGNIGRVAVLPQNIPEANINQHIAKISIVDGVSSEYIYQSLQQDSYSRHYERILTGQAYPQISLKQVRETPILLPSFEEQQKIAEVLSTVDQKIDLIDQKIAKTKKLKTGLMQKLFSEGVGVQGENGNWQPHSEFKESKFGLIPKSWNLDKMETYCSIVSGISPSKLPLSDVGYPFFKVEEFNYSPKLLSKARNYVDDVKLCHTGEFLLLPKRGAAIFLNKLRIAKGIFQIDTNVMGISFNRKIANLDFMLYRLLYENIENIADVSTIPQINNKHINPYIVPLPPLTEQLKIAEILSTVDEHLALLEKQKAETQQLKKGLMQKLLTGEWRVPLDTH